VYKDGAADAPEPPPVGYHARWLAGDRYAGMTRLQDHRWNSGRGRRTITQHVYKTPFFEHVRLNV